MVTNAFYFCCATFFLGAVVIAVARAQTLPNLTADLKSQTDANLLRVGGYRNMTPEGAFTSTLRAEEGSFDAYLRVAEHMEDVISESNCFLKDREWTEALDFFSSTHGWIKSNASSCSSSTRISRKNPLKLSGAQLFERLQSQAKLANSVAGAVHALTANNFTEVSSPSGYTYETGRWQKCVVESATGIRVMSLEGRPLWYLLIGITNDDIRKALPDWQRQYVSEFVGVDLEGRQFLSPLLQNVRPAGSTNVSTPREPLATVLGLWMGPVSFSGVYDMSPIDVPALISGLEATSVDENQATDALTPSNIAILSLPMTMNLIPVSLLVDVSTLGLLMYTILTDILTSVPFIIKGFELLSMAKRRKVLQETWYSGTRGDTFMVVESWAAKCRIAEVDQIGAVFVGVGFGILVLGLIIELQAARLRKKWTRNGALVLPSRKRIILALLGQDVDPPVEGEEGRPFFDPNNELAAFAAQQQATLSHRRF